MTLVAPSSAPARAIGLPLLLLATLALNPLVPAQSGSLRFEDIVPATADDFIAWISFAGIDHCAAAVEELGLYKLWQEPEVQKFFQKVIESYEEEAASSSPEDRETWERVKSLFSGRVCLAVTGLTRIAPPDSPPVLPFPGLVLALDIGTKGGEVEDVLGDLAGRLAAASEVASIERHAYGAHAITEIELSPSDERPRFSICHAIVENLLLVGLNDHHLRKALDNIGSQKTTTLAALPEFRRARSKGAEAPLFEVFVNLQTLGSRLRGFLPDEWREGLHHLGIDGLRALYLSSGITKGEGLETIYLDAPAPRRGLLALAKQGLTPELLAKVPNTAVSVVGFRMDPAALWETLWRSIESFDPGLVTAATARLAALEEEAGFKVRDELIAALGDEVLAYTSLSRGIPVPDFVLSIAIRDRAKAERLLSLLESQARVPFQSVDYRGRTLRMAQMPRLDGLPIKPRPGYCLLEDRLVVALMPMGLKNAVREPVEAAGEEGDETSKPRPLIQSDSFRWATHGLRASEGTFLAFFDVGRLIADSTKLMKSLGFAMDQVEGFRLADAPSAETITKYLKGWAAVGYGDEDGLVLRARSPGVATLLGLGSRFLKEAPGLPHLVIRDAMVETSRMLAGMRRHRGHIVIPDSSPAPSPRPSDQPVNPLREGDPQEAEFRRRIERTTAAIEANPENAAAYFNRGNAYHQLREFAKAAADLQRAHEMGAYIPTTTYNAACCLSLLGDRDAALEWFGKALENGFDNWPLIERDSDLDNIRPDPRFRELVDRHRGKRQ